MRAKRDRGAKVSGFPSQLRGSLARPCPACDAAPGKKCVVWRVQRGERLYPDRTRCKPHPERRRAT